MPRFARHTSGVRNEGAYTCTLGALVANVDGPLPATQPVGALFWMAFQFGIGVASPTQVSTRRVFGKPVWSINDAMLLLSSVLPYAPIEPLIAKPGAVDVRGD